MLIGEIKQEARKNLEGKWGKAALLVLAFFAVEFVIGFILGILESIPFLSLVGSIINIAISIPLGYAMIAAFFKFKEEGSVPYFYFVKEAKENFKKSWAVAFKMLLKILPWVILYIVATFLLGFAVGFGVVGGNTGILALLAIVLFVFAAIMLVIKSFAYTLIYYILYKKPELSAAEIVAESERLMDGHKWKYFVLNLSFIGWAILSAFTFGIGMFFLIPYMQVAQICFYEDLAGKSVIKEEANDDNPIK